MASREHYAKMRSYSSPMSAKWITKPLSKDLDENVRLLDVALGGAPDLIQRRLSVDPKGRIEALVVGLDGMFDPDYVSDHVILPLFRRVKEEKESHMDDFSHVAEILSAVNEVTQADSLDQVVQEILTGSVAVMMDGDARAIIVGCAAPPARSIEEPEAETLTQGPRDGFNESLSTTIALIRKRVQAAELRLRSFRVGELSPTAVTVVYLKGRVDFDVLQTIQQRIQNIRVDSILDTGTLAEYLTDQRYPVFPTTLLTERPDRVAAGIMEGKVAVAVEGSPVVLLAPNSLWDFLMSPEDYYENPFLLTFIRWVRLIAFLVALLGPSLYIAGTSFHQEMIPTPLALRIAAGREGTAFPAVIEAFVLEVQFEILREAGLRIPRKIGTAVSIVGVLVIGQALVAAGVVSPIMIVVVGATAVASFAVPIFAFSTPSRLLRFPLMILAGTFGIYGLVLGMFLILAHVSALTSFGRPYLTPLAPLRWRELLDSPFFRAPQWNQKPEEGDPRAGHFQRSSRRKV